MEDDNNTKNIDQPDHDQDLEEAEEALSLSELSLQDTDHQNKEIPTQIPQSSSETPDQFFEFFNRDFKTEYNMCSAEDIIFCGKLIPNLSVNSSSSSTDQTQKSIFINEKKQIPFRRRSESLSELESYSVTRSSSTKNRTIMRNCKSLDYKKLRQASKSMILPWPEMDRNSSVKSVGGKSDVSAKKSIKPRWSYLMLFGMVKFPAEMDLEDIKNRQVRKNPSRLFPPVDADVGK